MRLNPLTYGITALRGALALAPGSLASATEATAPVAATSLGLPLAITVGLTLLAFGADLLVTRGGRVE